jgi:UDP-N-acetyl-D-mannosaminuronate dehydrogenase
MTANELAVYLEDITDSEESPYRQAATMLRQQASEIEKYKDITDRYQNMLGGAEIEIEVLKAQLEKERNIYAYALYKKASEK